VTPPPEHKEQAPAPVERKSTATPPKASMPPEQKSPAAAKIEQMRKENTSPFVSPRETKVTKPETVKIPKPPVVGKSASENKREASPPPKPTEERQTRDAKGKDTDKKKSR
jgi:hypothetical protein